MSEHFKNEPVANLPDIATTPFQKIDRNYFKVISINFFLITLFICIGIFLLQQFVFSESILQYNIYEFLGVIVFSSILYTYFFLAFPKRKYALREKDISYKSGLLFLKTTTVPFSRIQHVETDEKPISRIFKLASLSVFTAGDSSDDLLIKGIKKQEALKIKEFISSKINA